MKSEDAIQLLRGLHEEAASLPPSISSAEFSSWQQRTRSVLTQSLGASHAITESFVDLSWTPAMFNLDNADFAFMAAFWGTRPQAQGMIEAAIFELEQLRRSAHIVEDEGIDPELWLHVSAHVAAEDWGKVASQSSIFTEDRIRRWAGRPADEVGEKLMSAVFGPKGDYRLGLTEPEKEGWLLLAMGTSKALRNAHAHRIQNREDHKRYALGVLGVSSLLLTQMRFEHSNRFHDVSPAKDPASGDS